MKAHFHWLLQEYSWIILVFVSIACSNINSSNSNEFTLSGKIINQDTGKITLRYVLNYEIILDTVEIRKGDFKFKGVIPEPTRATLNGGDEQNNTELYIEPGFIKITLTKDNFKDFKITGSKSSEEELALRAIESPIFNQMELVRQKLFKLEDSLEKLNNVIEQKTLTREIEYLRNQWAQISTTLHGAQLTFIKANPKSFPAMNRLSILGQYLSLDSLKTYYYGMDTLVQNGKDGIILKDDIRRLENTIVGAVAPNFIAIDLKGDTISLSKFKGAKVVLLEFWSSYCFPCRKSFSFLMNLFQKYHPKGFEIIAISCDLSKKAWISAVEKDEISLWHNVPVAEKNIPGQIKSTDIKANYYIYGVPLQLLIDKNGIIIGKWTSKSKVNDEALAEKLSEILQ